MYLVDVIVSSMEQAFNILSSMDALIGKYGVASVSELYELAGITSTYDDQKYGWLDIETAEIKPVRGGYKLVMPKVLPIGDLCNFDNKTVSHSDYECDDKMVSHPDHYQSKNGLEVIDVIDAFTSDLKGIEATDTGNIIKYICRWKSKNGVQDLKKAMWYLRHLIDHIEKENEHE